MNALVDLCKAGVGGSSPPVSTQINLDGPQAGDRRAPVIMSPTLFRAPQVPLHPFTRPASRF